MIHNDLGPTTVATVDEARNDRLAGSIGFQNNSSAAAAQARCPQKQGLSHPKLLTVTDGRNCIGFLLSRGRDGIEAFTSDETSIGLFPTAKLAADALSARAAS